ncbi:MAG: L,D-transpeptidase [Solirubrobacteraceae bacterium]
MWLAVLAVWLTPAAAQAQAPGNANTVVAAGAQDPLAGLKSPGDTVVLSDEQRTTRWAHAQETSRILSAPRRSARPIARLRFLTEDRTAEVYLVLGARTDSVRRRWLQIRVPGRPNGRTGWVPEDALSELYVVRTQLVIDRSKLRAALYRKGKQIWSARVAVGKSATPTPRGNFWIRERLRGLGNGTTYGPWAFGTSAYSNLSDWPGGGVVGIHGTNQPELIPGRPSHGCVRVRNDKIRRLARLMPIGTPVLVIG